MMWIIFVFLSILACVLLIFGEMLLFVITLILLILVFTGAMKREQ